MRSDITFFLPRIKTSIYSNSEQFIDYLSKISQIPESGRLPNKILYIVVAEKV
ncbi:hypothetical protein LEP1GSC168_0157 [Leptospira santarosai str. HAI134]|nr:hypothetical protein LEP1GSC168_0157 [Leptospira santarosai str. HAI134]